MGLFQSALRVRLGNRLNLPMVPRQPGVWASPLSHLTNGYGLTHFLRFVNTLYLLVPLSEQIDLYPFG